MHKSDTLDDASTHAVLLQDALLKLKNIHEMRIGAAENKDKISAELEQTIELYDGFFTIYLDEGLEAAKSHYKKHLHGRETGAVNTNVATFECVEKSADVLMANQNVRGGLSDQIKSLFSFDKELPDYRMLRRDVAQMIRDPHIMFFVLLATTLPAAMMLVDWMDNRKDRRYDIFHASVAVSQTGAFPIDIVNISASGARFVCDEETKIGDRLFVTICSNAVIARVVWVGNGSTGVKFSEKLNKAVLSELIAEKAEA